MEAHTPKDHQNHGTDEECGCWTGDGESIACPSCGAAYKLINVLKFPRWHCYDCEALVYREEVAPKNM